MDKFIFKNISGSNESFRLCVEFNNEYDFNLMILKNSKAWIAKVEQKNINSQAKQLEIDVDEYLKKIREYLKNTPASVNLRFNNKDFIINCVLENNMKVIYFTQELEKANYNDCAEIIMEKFYEERSNSLQRNITLNKENNELKKSNNQLQAVLNEFIERKKTDDEELFSNFILVLNEKKSKIQHLNELLEAFRRGRSSVNPSVKVKKRTKKQEHVQVKNEKKDISSESNSEEDYDTDNERSKKVQDSSNEDLDIKPGLKRNDIDPTPSSSKFDLFADDSPPRHLPKRIKSEPSVNNNNNCYVKPSTSKQSPRNKNENDTLDHVTQDNSPNVNFSTQDLLDNI